MSDSTLHPAHPDASHPDIDVLADHAEELLAPEQSAELTAHLDSCAECRDTYAALAELTTLLGDEPAPGPMPDDVVARIDAALTAERANGTTDAAGADTGGTADNGTTDADTDTDATPERARSVRRPAGDRPADNRPGGVRPRRSTRMRRVLTTLAIFLAVGGIGVAVSRGGDIDNTSGASSSAGGVAAAAAPSASPSDGVSYDFTQANLAAEVQRLASDTQHAAGRNPAAAGSATAAPSSPAPLPSGSGGPGRMSPNTNDTNPSAGTTPFSASAQGQPAAPPCVLNAVPRADAPAVQGVGRYLGVQVFALLYPDDNDPAHRWDVYLVQDSCAAPLVLLHQSVPRA